MWRSVGEQAEKGKEENTYLASLAVQVQPECLHRGAWSFPLSRNPWAQLGRSKQDWTSPDGGTALCATVVCLSSSGRAFWLYTADSYTNRWKAQLSSHCFRPLCSRFHKECHFFVCWTKGFLSGGTDYLFRSVHVSEKCRALSVARFRAVQRQLPLAWVPFWQIQGFRKEWNNSPGVLEDKAQISSVISQLGGQLMSRWRASVPGPGSECWNSTDLGHADFTVE